MAFCKSCGAYIPDGLSACLACGFDENEKKAAAEAAQKAEQEAAEQKRIRQEQEDLARQEMERQRRLQQEKNRQWAEQEKARRERQEENRQWAREEYARRQAENEAEEFRTRQSNQSASEANGTEDRHEKSKTGNQALAALSYLSFFFALPLIFTPEDGFATYHAKQGLRLFIFGAVADLVAKILPLGWILSLFRLYCIYKGITNALHGKKEPLPYIGTLGNK